PSAPRYPVRMPQRVLLARIVGVGPVCAVALTIAVGGCANRYSLCGWENSRPRELKALGEWKIEPGDAVKWGTPRLFAVRRKGIVAGAPARVPRDVLVP